VLLILIIKFKQQMREFILSIFGYRFSLPG
jgi:hypothetical protein